MSEPNFYTTKFSTDNLLAIEMRKTKMLMNKPVYLGLSILELSKILINELLYKYVISKYDEKTKLCYMDTDSYIVYIKTDDIYKEMLKMMLKVDLILQNMIYIDNSLEEKIEK